MNRKITIMHFVSGLVSGGVEQMLINYCSEMDKNQFEFIVVYQHEPVEVCIDKIKQAGCKTYRITGRNENFLKNIIDSYKIIKKYRPDIVYAHMNLMNFCATIPAAILKVSVRISHSHIAEKNKSILYKVMSFICKKLIAISSTTYFACGEDAGKYMYGKKKFSVIRNAVDFNKYSKTKDNLRNELKIENKFVIGHVGRFTEQKNHKRLIDIFQSYLKINKNSVLLLAGTGELQTEIQEYVKRLHLEDKVYFLGVVYDMRLFYSTIDFFILPSLYEGFPVVALEVQVAGIWSVMSDKIDKKVQITELVSLLPLEKSDDEWAKAIHNILLNEHPTDNIKQLTEAGYDIVVEAKRLEKKYKSLITA